MLKPLQCVTYTFHLNLGEESSSHEHAQRDGEDEDEGQRQRDRAGLHNPQQGQAHELDDGEQVHPVRLHLRRERERH